MFRQLSQYFLSPKKEREYVPVRHTFFRDSKIAQQLHETGYYVADFLGSKERVALLELYEKNHQLDNRQDGVFFGTFSKDTEYRKKVHNAINEILAQSFNKWFINYKSTINNFVIKTPGRSTRVPIHQDGAALDEEKYSSINVWIPLQAAIPLNGALSVIPRSHNIFTPYRCNTIPSLVKNIEKELYSYFLPIYLELGQVLFFDSRLFHYSTPNLSETNRVAIVCRICPVESSVMSYYREKEKKDAPIEMWCCPDDFLISIVGYNDDVRPPGAKLMGYKYVDVEPLTMEDFDIKRKRYGIISQNQQPAFNEEQFNFLMEPVHKST
jgi:hypothetical protein